MAEAKKKAAGSAKSSSKAAAKKKAPAAKAVARKKTVKAKTAVPKKAAKAKAASTGGSNFASPSSGGMTLGTIKPTRGSWPKRTRVGRGHGSGMVKTGGEGGKGQTVRSGGGKGPAFEGGQTPWARRLPHKRGYSQKARDIGHFRSTFAVLNLHQLASWDPAVEVTPASLKEKGLLKDLCDGVKILGGSRDGATLPTGLKFRAILFSGTAREALAAAGASFEENA
ncbi:MAG: 50S ribosomal protein L15 [Candidatus Eremiobacteraeota bacterium]|nr:50S ribosomal protein L15 [Candidatus Eremiobacteraeota bacterium]